MQLKRNIAILAVAALVFTSSTWGQSASTLLQEGIFIEETVGNLDAAIKIYEKIVDDAKSNRAYAAQAQYRVGMCYLKQGRKVRAVGAFQELVEQFSKQTELVAQAQVQLSKLGYAPTSAAASGMSARRLWAGPDVDILGAPSPDGRNLSYVDWETGDLAIRDLTTGRNRRLTNKGSWFESTEFAEFSVISPDGKQVAYAWFNEDFFYDLRIIKLDGSESHVLYRNEEVAYVQPKAWSPDGRHILAAFSRKDRTNQIVLVAVADGSVRVLKTFDWRYPGKMSFSPDGRYIVYDFPPQEESPERDIFLLATDGSREIALVEHPADDLFPVWAPDGKRVLFASDRTGAFGAWVIQVTEGKPQGSAELVKKDMGKIFPMGFTANGSYYYGISTRMNDVYIAKVDMTRGKVLSSPAKASQRFVGSNSAPDWSPDGRHLAFISQRGPVPFGVRSRIISIRSVETGQERELSPRLNYVGGPRWSPDGRSLLVTGADEKGRRGHYQIDAQTGDVTPIVQSEPGVYFRQATWSPDGKAIFYTRNESGTKSSSIVLRDLETSREKELYRTVSPSFAQGLALSPGGRQLAFILFDQATRSDSLMVMAATGGEPRELLRVQEPEGLANGAIVWTPDGREVLFGRSHSQSLQEQTIELWRISAEGGEPQKLGLAMDQLRDLRIHPDGRQIAFSSGQYSAELWVMENFLPEAKVAAASGMSARRLWAGPDVNLYGLVAPTPDGRYLTFVDGRNLAVRDLVTGEKRTLKKGTRPENAEYSVASPDGRRVAYEWENSDDFDELRVMGMDGTGDRLLYRNRETESIRPYAWSPDGKRLAVVRRLRDQTRQIAWVSVADGALTVLRSLEWRYVFKMSLSPDGRYLVYDAPARRDRPRHDIFLLAADGSREVPLIQHPAGDYGPVWMPDGKRVLFASDRTGDWGLWSIRVADGKPQGSAELVRPNMGEFLPLGFTRDGSFSYVSQSKMQDVYMAEIDPATGKIQAEPVSLAMSFVGHNEAPVWSPDGRHMAYLSTRGTLSFGQGSDTIVIRSLETGEERQLTPELNISDGDFTWSPDGRSFLVTHLDRKGGQGFYRVNAQTGDFTLLVERKPGEGEIEDQVWSPDGITVFFDRHKTPDGDCRLMMRNVETDQEKELYRPAPGVGLSSLALSRDGRQLAFVLRDEGMDARTLQIMPVGGGEPRELLRTESRLAPHSISRSSGIAWTPDGRHVLVMRHTPDSAPDYQPGHMHSLWRVPVDGGEPVELGLTMEGMRFPSVHPDGRRITFSDRRFGDREVWVMENFLPELTAAK